MDAFEDLVARVIERDGYWVRQNVKVDLSKEDKVALKLPSLPRPDLDVLAYKPSQNTIVWVECKSFLDSLGVMFSSFHPEDKGARRYRVFTNDDYRRIVSARLVEQCIRAGLCKPRPKLQYWLVAGHVYHKGEAELRALFRGNGWTFRGPEWLREKLAERATDGYTNDIVTMVAKVMELGSLPA